MITQDVNREYKIEEPDKVTKKLLELEAKLDLFKPEDFDDLFENAKQEGWVK